MSNTVLFKDENGARAAALHLISTMKYHNKQVRFECFPHELGTIIKTNDEGSEYLPLDCNGTKHLPAKQISHTHVWFGYCIVCGHYGFDCTGHKQQKCTRCESRPAEDFGDGLCSYCHDLKAGD